MPERTTLDDLDGSPHAEVFDRGEPRTVRLRLDADERVPAHSHPGTNVIFHLLSGRVDLTLDGEVYDLDAGDLVRFDGDCRISPNALTASTALVVFAPDAGGADSTEA
jgi:hypothetical protein